MLKNTNQQQVFTACFSLYYAYFVCCFFGAYQNSKKKFQIVAATPIIFNLTLIIFALSSSELSLGVIGIAILTAGMLQLIINGIASAYLNYIPSLDFNFDRALMSSFFSKAYPGNICCGYISIKCLGRYSICIVSCNRKSNLVISFR